MHKFKAYIELVEETIEELVREEIADDELSTEIESELHVLFENCRHAKEYLAEMEREAHVAPMGGVR